MKNELEDKVYATFVHINLDKNMDIISMNEIDSTNLVSRYIKILKNHSNYFLIHDDLFERDDFERINRYSAYFLFNSILEYLYLEKELKNQGYNVNFPPEAKIIDCLY